MKVKCPRCGQLAEYEGNPTRPFCSERCKLIDLGAWASEDYAIPSAHTPRPETSSKEGSQTADRTEGDD